MKSIPFPLQYRHPLWQKFRLKVLEEKGYVCQMCDSKDDQLHVHHGYYEKGKMLWEHPMETMWVLCDSCHELTTMGNRRLREDIAKVHPDFLGILMGVARTLSEQDPKDKETARRAVQATMAWQSLSDAEISSDKSLLDEWKRQLSQLDLEGVALNKAKVQVAETILAEVGA